MKNTKMNFQNKLRTVSAILILMLLNSISWAQVNNIKLTKGIRGQSNFEYERSLNASTSIVGGIRSYSDSFEKNNFKNKGTRLSFEYRKYLNGGVKTMNGIYLAPNFSFGRHKVSYEHIPSSKIGWTLFSVGAALATQNADLLYFPEQEETVRGEDKVIASSVGVKLGYQKRWEAVTLDMGMNLSNNSVSDSKGLSVSDGTIKKYNNDLQGADLNLYIGMGFAF